MRLFLAALVLTGAVSVSAFPAKRQTYPTTNIDADILQYALTVSCPSVFPESSLTHPARTPRERILQESSVFMEPTSLHRCRFLAHVL